MASKTAFSVSSGGIKYVPKNTFGILTPLFNVAYSIFTSVDIIRMKSRIQLLEDGVKSIFHNFYILI